MENIIKSYFQGGKWKQTSIYRVIGPRDVKLRKGVWNNAENSYEEENNFSKSELLQSVVL